MKSQTFISLGKLIIINRIRVPNSVHQNLMVPQRIECAHAGGARAWGLVFTITAIVASVGTLAFLLTASGEQIDFDRKRSKTSAAA